jgi:hypothetical protein
VADAVYDQVQPAFSEKELADLTLAVAAINAWNRISIAGRIVPGAYQAAAPLAGQAAAPAAAPAPAAR